MPFTYCNLHYWNEIKTFYTFWFEKITNQTPMSMFILALNAQSSIQNCCLILYDCCSSNGKPNKTYCKESIYVHTVHMHYVNMNEWYVETWYPRIPINNSLDFIDTLLARVCLEGNVCIYVLCTILCTLYVGWACDGRLFLMLMYCLYLPFLHAYTFSF